MKNQAEAAEQSSEVAPRYVPTEREQAIVDAYVNRRAALKPPAPSLKIVEKDGVSRIRVDHDDPQTGMALIANALGGADPDFFDGLVRQLASAAGRGAKVDEDGLNFMLSVIKDIEPRDQLEAMLAAQMAAVHMSTMTLARRLNHADAPPEQDSAERAFNKLARTFTNQVDALKRYRTGGQQTVTVHSVNVNEGGQAIVGNVTHAGAMDAGKNGERPHASEPRSIAHAPGEAMSSPVEAEREAVPVASGERA